MKLILVSLNVKIATIRTVLAAIPRRVPNPKSTIEITIAHHLYVNMSVRNELNET